MPAPPLARLAFPAVISLIVFLAYGSQILFSTLEPHSLSRQQSVVFNILIACIWVTYLRACFTDPGSVVGMDVDRGSALQGVKGGTRWCGKCQARKPPRAHHCKICQRCIPKMDHHCPWTINCVSHRTLPYFLRFLFYAVASMTYLEYFLYLRVAVLWEGRNLPSYLGPSATQMVFLLVFVFVNSVTLFALGILFVRNVWCLGGNVTTIEGWEIERHETLVHRARKRGGFLDGPNGTRIRIQRQEFPYDIGIYANIRQGMGSSPLLWLWPFTPSQSNDSGQDFETNGFEGSGLDEFSGAADMNSLDPSLSWPPPDPDRMPRFRFHSSDRQVSFRKMEMESDQDRLNAFRQRQQQDMKRIRNGSSTTNHGRAYGANRDEDSPENTDPESEKAFTQTNGTGGWKDSDGDRLDDFGVDEDVEFHEEDELPLAEVLRRKTTYTSDG